MLTPSAEPEPEAQRTSCRPSQPGATSDARRRPGAGRPPGLPLQVFEFLRNAQVNFKEDATECLGSLCTAETISTIHYLILEIFLNMTIDLG